MKNLRIIIAFFVCAVFTLALCLPEAFAAANADLLGDITNKFYTEAERWSTTLEQVAINIFYWFLVIDIAIFGIRGALDMYKGNNIASLFAEFTTLILFAAFMFTCLKYYKEWSSNVINGLSQVGEQLGYASVNDGELLQIGIKLASEFWDAMSLGSPMMIVPFCIAGLAFLVIFALMAAEIIMIKVESYLVMNAGIFLLGFGGMRYFKDYSINFMKYAFTVAVKLFVLQCLIGIAGSFFSNFINTGLTWRDMGITLGGAVVMLGLVKNIPSIISSLIMGAHGGGGGGMVGAVAAAGAMGAAAGKNLSKIASLLEARNISKGQAKGDAKGPVIDV